MRMRLRQRRLLLRWRVFLRMLLRMMVPSPAVRRRVRVPGIPCIGWWWWCLPRRREMVRPVVVLGC